MTTEAEPPAPPLNPTLLPPVPPVALKMTLTVPLPETP